MLSLLIGWRKRSTLIFDRNDYLGINPSSHSGLIYDSKRETGVEVRRKDQQTPHYYNIFDLKVGECEHASVCDGIKTEYEPPQSLR